MHLSVPKCLTSPCVCKYTTLQNQKQRFFHVITETFALKHYTDVKFSQEVYKPKLCSKCPPSASTQADSRQCN